MPFWRAWTASQFLSSVGVAVASADAGKKGNGKRSRSIKPACFKSYVKTFLDTASSVQQLVNFNFSTVDRGDFR